MAQSNLDSLLDLIPFDGIASKLGVDTSTIQSAVQQALPVIVGGMAVNASDPEGAKSLENAVGQHSPAAGTLDLDAIDAQDGQKIVKHVLGDKEQEVQRALSVGGADIDVVKLLPMLLPLLAPIVMKFLAGKQQEAAPAESAQSAEAGSGGIENVLGDVLGGLLGGGKQQSSGGGLGDVLGGLLGGGSQQGSGGGLGGLLGGLLGGK